MAFACTPVSAMASWYWRPLPGAGDERESERASEEKGG
jgi:hypothetical protein